MNIRDIGNSTDTILQVDATARFETGAGTGVQEETPVTQAQPAERRDQYVRQTDNNAEERRDVYIRPAIRTIRNALYDVTDIQRSGADVMSARIQEGETTQTGEKIARKLVDMILPMGRKNLRIYQKKE